VRETKLGLLHPLDTPLHAQALAAYSGRRRGRKELKNDKKANSMKKRVRNKHVRNIFSFSSKVKGMFFKF